MCHCLSLIYGMQPRDLRHDDARVTRGSALACTGTSSLADSRLLSGLPTTHPSPAAPLATFHIAVYRLTWSCDDYLIMQLYMIDCLIISH